MSTQGALPFKKRERGDLTPLPSSSSSTCRPKYEVFLSFRGVDTRKSFTDHLYNALKNKSIFTFRDDEELQRGKPISQELLKAIEESRFAIVIFSKNYASSTWCLDELVHIVRCKKETGLEIVPVFYDVNPSDVRKQTGTFAQAFDEHKERFKESIEKVETWKIALKEVADLSGWDLQDRHEFEFIQHIVKKIMEKLNSKSSSITKNFIGIESAMEKLIPSYLGFENNVYMIGIYGIGGLGKTTLARVVYDEFRIRFESSSFIANVREESKKHGLHKLQQQLLVDILDDRNICINNDYDGVDMIKKRLCCKKVLLVIDDVNHLDQLEKLVGEHGWFGLGSWIIITTRDEHVLKVHGVLNRYKPNGLNNDDALKLFCLKAFKNEQPEEGYMQLSQAVVKYASGLPLALIILGTFLFGRTIVDWQSALDSFKETGGEIFDILRISYDGLEEMWKKIFLDIACFFRGWKENQVIEILENCGFKARIGISVLLDKSLLTVNKKGSLEMHDLLQEMGEKIECSKLGGNLGMQSRLWLIKDLLRVLENDKETEAIEAIVVTYGEEDFDFVKFPDGFSKMSNLRLLIIEWDYLKRKWGNLNALNDQKHLALPSNLRYLSWSRCPFKSLAFKFERMELVYLELQHSKFECLWEKAMFADKLKFINLSESKNLIRTPDFSGVLMLEGLKLSYCDRLVEIHPSIGQLCKLRYLELECCYSLTDLPSMSAKMQSLMVLLLRNCSKLSSFPKFTGIMKSLSELNLCGTAIKKVEPSSIKCLTALTLLDLSCCKYLECLPSNMDNLRSLETLNLQGCDRLVLTDLPSMSAKMQFLTVLCFSGCSKLSSFPKFTGIMKSLSKLNLHGTAIKKVESSSIECLTALTLLDLSCCEYLECLPSNMDNLRSLETLKLRGCKKLESLPIRLPSTIRLIDVEHCFSLKWKQKGVKLSIWSQLFSQWFPYDERRGRQGFKILFHFLQELLCCKAVLYGSIIPSPLTHQRLGCHFRSIKLPSNWYNSKWIGFALWASLFDNFGWKCDCRARVIVLCDIHHNHCAFELFATLISFKVNICLLYLSRDDWLAKVGNGECNRIEVIFKINEGTQFVQESGASLIYKQDVNEFNQTNVQCLIKSFGGEVSIYKLTAGDDDDDDDDDDVHILDDDVHIFDDDDFDDDVI